MGTGRMCANLLRKEQLPEFVLCRGPLLLASIDGFDDGAVEGGDVFE
jgi:hypothetical protein